MFLGLIKSGYTGNVAKRKCNVSFMALTLRSNDGESEITFELENPSEYGCDQGFQSTVVLKGQQFDGEHHFPIHVLMKGFWLRAASLEEIRAHLSGWIKKPLNQLKVEELIGTFEIARLPEQVARLSFGLASNQATNPNPEVAFAFKVGGLTGEFSFVTDQSCLAAFASELMKCRPQYL